MKKVNLNTITKAFYEAKKNEISVRPAADYVSEKIIPMLESVAQTGAYFCLVKINDELSWEEVQKEILAQAECKIVGEGRIFTVDWF